MFYSDSIDSSTIGAHLYRAISSNDEHTFLILLSFKTIIPLSEIKPMIQNAEEEFIHPLSLAIYNPNIFRKMLDNYSSEIDMDIAEDAFKISVCNGLWVPIESLLMQIPHKISDDCKGISLRLAIEGQYFGIVNKLLDLFSRKINNAYKIMSLMTALRYKNKDTIKLLLSDESVIEASVYSIRSIFQQAGISLSEPQKNIPGFEDVIEKINTIPGIQLILLIYSESKTKYNLDNGLENEKIKFFLKENSSKIKKDYKKVALELSVEEKRIDVLNALLSDKSVVKIATWNNNVVLQEAKRYIGSENENIFNRLMEIPAVAFLEKSTYDSDDSLLSQYIKSTDKGRALVAAAENNNEKFSRSILHAWGENISEKYKINSLIRAVEEDRFEAFCVLLDDEFLSNKYITPDNKGLAFAIAAENSNKKFVERMLSKWGDLIPIDYKKNALNNAIKEGNVNVFFALLEHSSIAEIMDKTTLSFLKDRVREEIDNSSIDDMQIIYDSMIDQLKALALSDNVQNNGKEKHNRF